MYLQYFGSHNVEAVTESWVKAEMSWVEVGGAGWRWMELDEDGWSWVGVGAWWVHGAQYKPCTNLHPAPSFSPISTSSNHLISASAHLSATSCKNQRYKNQTTARNWAISPNLGRKIQSCFFCLKIGFYGNLKMMIPNPDLDFGNSELKIHFWANLGGKSQSCPFCLKIGTAGILEELIPILDLDFWNSNPRINFCANLCRKKN